MGITGNKDQSVLLSGGGGSLPPIEGILPAPQHTGQVGGGGNDVRGIDARLCGVVGVVAIRACGHGLAEMTGVVLGHGVAVGLGQTVVYLNAEQQSGIHHGHLHPKGVSLHHAGRVGQNGMKLLQGAELIQSGGGEEELLLTAVYEKIVVPVWGFLEAHLRPGQDGKAQLLPLLAGGVVALQATSHGGAVIGTDQLLLEPAEKAGKIVIRDDHAAVTGGVVDAHQLGGGGVGGQIAFRGVAVKLVTGHGVPPRG